MKYLSVQLDLLSDPYQLWYLYVFVVVSVMALWSTCSEHRSNFYPNYSMCFYLMNSLKNPRSFKEYLDRGRICSQLLLSPPSLKGTPVIFKYDSCMSVWPGISYFIILLSLNFVWNSGLKLILNPKWRKTFLFVSLPILFHMQASQRTTLLCAVPWSPRKKYSNCSMI